MSSRSFLVLFFFTAVVLTSPSVASVQNLILEENESFKPPAKAPSGEEIENTFYFEYSRKSKPPTGAPSPFSWDESKSQKNRKPKPPTGAPSPVSWDMIGAPPPWQETKTGENRKPKPKPPTGAPSPVSWDETMTDENRKPKPKPPTSAPSPFSWDETKTEEKILDIKEAKPSNCPTRPKPLITKDPAPSPLDSEHKSSIIVPTPTYSRQLLFPKVPPSPSEDSEESLLIDWQG